MKTRIINLPCRNSAAALYFSATCRNVKNLRNTANFYIRNTMSGIRKSPEERKEDGAHGCVRRVKAEGTSRRTARLTG